MRVRMYMGSDHGGIALRRHLAEVLTAEGHDVVAEFGPSVATEKVDYPDVAEEVCRAVLGDDDSLAVLVCGTGQGMAMSANKVPGIRAGVVLDVFSAKMIREHNDAQVLCLGERVVGQELARELVLAFTHARFSGDRHMRRVAKMTALEEKRKGG